MRLTLGLRLFTIALSLSAPLALCLPGAAHAAATRTWISGVGDDANPCTRTAPCKTWAGAITKTEAGGEIIALDPGGFGALTITKSITLDGGGGQVASTLVSGTNGINVAAGPSDHVVIRNVHLQGLLGGGNASAGLNGIAFTSGASLTLENDVIDGFADNGIAIQNSGAATVNISDTTAENNGHAGLLVKPSAATNVVVDHDHFENDGCGVVASAESSSACAETGTGSQINMAIVDSSMSENNEDGLLANGALAEVSLSDDLITGNEVGINSGSAGATTYQCTNVVIGNTTNGSARATNNSGCGSDGPTAATGATNKQRLRAGRRRSEARSRSLRPGAYRLALEGL